jgi:hypothetical protein
MTRWMKYLAVLVPMLLLSSCLLTPGKFTSSLDIRADRTFTFAYQGELIATDFDKSLPDFKDDKSDDAGTKAKDGEPAPEFETGPRAKDSAYLHHIAYKKPLKAKGDKALSPKEQASNAKMQAITDALTKEKGFRSVRYLGDNKFYVDYAITSTLDRGYIFPYNIDAQAIFPFVVIDVRADGKVRMQAPGFANASDKSGGMGGMGAPGGDASAAKAIDGTFTLTTDAEIISQNQEDGATDTPRGKQVIWKISPLTKVAPMATLRFQASTKQP